MYTKAFIIISAFILFFSIVYSGPPQLPYIIGGNIEIDGEKAPEGTLIEIIDSFNNIMAEFEVFKKGEYGPIKIPADDPETEEKEGGVENEIMRIKVNGKETEYSFKWKSGGFNYSYNLKLNFKCNDCDNDGFNSSVDCNDFNEKINPDAEEICDNIDNNCNGEIDEGLTRKCGTNLGICREGIEICKNGVWSNCIGAIMPQNEICDNKDNDCDGLIDEGCSEVNGNSNKKIDIKNVSINRTKNEKRCIEEWVCTSWSSCKNGIQKRSCIDWNNCSVKFKNFREKIEERKCESIKGATKLTGKYSINKIKFNGYYLLITLTFILIFFFGWLRYK